MTLICLIWAHYDLLISFCPFNWIGRDWNYLGSVASFVDACTGVICSLLDLYSKQFRVCSGRTNTWTFRNCKRIYVLCRRTDVGKLSFIVLRNSVKYDTMLWNLFVSILLNNGNLSLRFELLNILHVMLHQLLSISW